MRSMSSLLLPPSGGVGGAAARGGARQGAACRRRGARGREKRGVETASVDVFVSSGGADRCFPVIAAAVVARSREAPPTAEGIESAILLATSISSFEKKRQPVRLAEAKNDSRRDRVLRISLFCDFLFAWRFPIQDNTNQRFVSLPFLLL